MRKFLIAMLLAGAAAAPALAEPQDEQVRWHHGQQNDSKPQPAHSDGRGPHPQFTPPTVGHQPPVIVQQGQSAGFDRPHFGGRPNVAPPANPQVEGDRTYRGRFQGGVAPQDAGRQHDGEYRRNHGGFTGQVQQTEHTRNWNGQRDWNGQPDGRRDQWNGQRDGRDGRRDGWNGQRDWQRVTVQQGNRWSGGTWNRDWRNDRRYDWRRYRDQHRSIFRIGIYYDPFGYSYRPFDIGYQLMPAYYGQQYWLDPATYDLPFPPPGTMWVRYWNDALLVDLYTGQVIDSIQGFFW